MYEDDDLITVIRLENFPEWIINHINIVPIISASDGINLDTIIDNPFEAFAEGILKVGDIIFVQQLIPWFAKLDANNYDLKILNSINLRIVTQVSQTGFSTSALDSFYELSLKIINPRIYENNEQKKT